MTSRPPLPPFTAETAAQKVRLAQDAWNTRDPARVALAYTVESRWRNRAEFLEGREQIEAFLKRKWSREWHDDSGNWFRSYGNENWEFDEHGLMQRQSPALTTSPSRKAIGSFIGRSVAVPTIIRP